MSRFLAIVRMRCPRCLKGAVFGGFLRMNGRCPVCNLEFEREPGYFTGAMYGSYTLAVLTTMPVWVTMLALRYSGVAIMAASLSVLIVGVPIFFHYSRVMWLHWDHHFNPATFERDDGVSARHPR